MRTRRGRTAAIGLLVLAAGGLAALDLHLLQTPVDVAAVSPRQGSGEAALPATREPATPLDKKAAEQFKDTVDRPLFTPTRRKVQRKEAAPAEAPRAAAGRLRLIGVMRKGDETPRALMRLGDEATGKWVAEGGELGGWRLRQVNERSVIVEAGSRRQELKLPANVPTAAAAPKADGPVTPGGARRDDD